MGAKGLPPLLRPLKDYTDTLTNIQKQHRTVNPVVLVDVSTWLVAALNAKEAVEQRNTVPPVPATVVKNYVLDKVDELKKCKFDVLLVFDGQRNPCKATENQRREGEQAEEENLAKLRSIFSGTDTASYNEVLKTWKKMMKVTEDVLQVVIEACQAKGITVVGAPFEADHQLVSLAKQGVGDYVLNSDSDIPTCGAPNTIIRLSKKGKCCLVRYEDLLTCLLPRQVKSTKDTWTPRDLYALSCFLGNDFIANKANCGIKTTYNETMVAWLDLDTEEAKSDFISEYFSDDLNQIVLWKRVMAFFQYAPVFRIIPTDPSMTCQAAFLLKQYTIKLAPLNLAATCTAASWENNLMGFDRTISLQVTWKPDDCPEHIELFHMNKWVHTGRELVGISPEQNAEGQALVPWSNLDFQQLPAKYTPAPALKIWLLVRGVRRTIDHHIQKQLRQFLHQKRGSCARIDDDDHDDAMSDDNVEPDEDAVSGGNDSHHDDGDDDDNSVSDYDADYKVKESSDDDNETEDAEDEEVWQEACPGTGVVDVSDGAPVPICQTAQDWFDSLKVAEELRGRAQAYDTNEMEVAVTRVAAPNQDVAFEKRQLVRLKRFDAMVERGHFPRVLLSLYTRQTSVQRAARLLELAGVPCDLRHGILEQTDEHDDKSGDDMAA